MNPDEILAAYLALADFAERDVTASGKVLRDQYLVLATDAARAANRLEMAASLWQRLAHSHGTAQEVPRDVHHVR